MNQIIVPKQIFIGDTAELRYSFVCDDSFVNSFAKENLKANKELSASAFLEADFAKYSVKNVRLIQNGQNYFTISVIFVPWKTGTFNISPFNLTQAIYEMEYPEATDRNIEKDYIVEFEPVHILSIIEQNHLKEELAAPQNPKLLPGTIYTVYFRLILLLIFLIFGVILLIKHKKVAFMVKNLKLKLKYKKNRNGTIKALEKALSELKNNSINEKDFSEILQQKIRRYLEVRFSYPFANATSSEILKKYYEITLGILEEKKNSAVEDIASVFVRTDFIRYATGMENASYLENEADEIVEKLKTSIITIETEEKKFDKGEKK